MIGMKFGRWTVLALGKPQSFPTKKSVKRWLCRCDCGTERLVLQMTLRRGKSVSCGCYNREISSIKGRKHGMALSTEYVCWQSMRQRALNPNNERHAAYSDRGITICSRWDDFSLFLQDMGPRPSPRHSIDRIDNNAGYFPENCRWALSGEQMVNRRCTRLVEVNGEQIPLATLAKGCGIPSNTLRARIVDLGWPVEMAIKASVRPKRH